MNGEFALIEHPLLIALTSYVCSQVGSFQDVLFSGTGVMVKLDHISELIPRFVAPPNMNKRGDKKSIKRGRRKRRSLRRKSGRRRKCSRMSIMVHWRQKPPDCSAAGFRHWLFWRRTVRPCRRVVECHEQKTLVSLYPTSCRVK